MLQVSWTQIQRQGSQLPGKYFNCNFGMFIFSRCFYCLFQTFLFIFSRYFFYYLFQIFFYYLFQIFFLFCYLFQMFFYHLFQMVPQKKGEGVRLFLHLARGVAQGVLYRSPDDGSVIIGTQRNKDTASVLG